MLRSLLRDLRRSRSSNVLLLVLVFSMVLPLGCSIEPGGLLDNRGSSDGKRGRGDAKKKSGGASGPASSAEPYDPVTPTNLGSGHNEEGFARIAPLMHAHCTECHHAGTWLDLTSGADLETASKVLETVRAGTMPPLPRARLTAEEITALESWREGEVPEATATSVRGPSSRPVTPLLASTTLATYKAALPKVAWGRLDAILSSPSTLFWDKAAVPPAYQDTVGNGADIPFGARLNRTGKSLIVPEGKKLFSESGDAWSFPFGHTAGTDDSTNTVVVNFLSLPTGSDDALLPIAYRIESSQAGSLPVKRWNWAFPRGTIIGEILMIRDGGALLTTEIRTRERSIDRWATNVFRPFPSARALSLAIKQRRPTFAQTSPLKELVSALEDETTLRAKRLDSPDFANLVTLEGFVDAALPEIGDDELVRDLLKSTTFVSTYGTSWKSSGATRTFGPTGPSSARLSVVPHRLDSGLLEVRETTCEKCHDQGGYFIGDLVSEAVLYGDIWGVDRIFSFHPFSPDRIDASGNENRSVRPELTTIVVPYDDAQHPGNDYRFFRPTK